MIDASSLSRILLVDSDDLFRERIGGILANYGFEVTHAKSAPSALEEVSRHKPVLCLMETKLPGVDGLQLLRYFRSRHLFRTLPVVVLTSGISKIELANLVKLDVKGVFVKSEFSVESLIRKIQELINAPMPYDVFQKESGADSFLHMNPPSSQHVSDAVAEPGQAVGCPPVRILNKNSIDSLAALKTISVILEDLVAVASRSNSSLEDLEAVIRKDPIVAARLVRAANSAAFLRGAPVSHIEDSLRILGFTNVIRVAVAGGCLTKDELGGEVGPELKEIWANSLCVAMIAEKLSGRTEAAKHYMQAILCNLPIIFLIQFLGTDWFEWKRWAAKQAMTFGQLVESSTTMPLHKYVEHFFQSLKISSDLSKPLVEYYRFFMTHTHEEPGAQARKMDLWMQLATILGRGGFDLHEVRPLFRKEVSADDLRAVVDPVFAQEVGLIEASIGVNSTGHHVEHEGYGPILFWRDPKWSEIDPMVAYLESFADCIVVESFAEFLGHKGRRMAFVEPSSAQWQLLESEPSVLILHTEAVPESTMRPAGSMVKAPVCMRDLVAKMDRFFEVGSSFA